MSIGISMVMRTDMLMFIRVNISLVPVLRGSRKSLDSACRFPSRLLCVFRRVRLSAEKFLLTGSVNHTVRLIHAI
jgi:hypothetical protein